GFAFYAWFTLDGLAVRLILAAALVYIPLVFLVTIFGNVPMNERLDKMDSESEAAAAYWLIYGRAWTGWNTLRMIGAIVTAGCYLLAAVHID
ncbi:MAG: anthrone oxygenase family protein, partial [Pseudomonadota bacterium]|nr:anthrone oxygenase family protein [Pseudomonadota bacterium]